MDGIGRSRTEPPPVGSTRDRASDALVVACTLCYRRRHSPRPAVIGLERKCREKGERMVGGDSAKVDDFFAAGRAAAAHGWFDAVLASGPEILELTPVGPPVVVVVDGADLNVQKAKALASASGAGRRILVANTGSPLSPEALVWLGGQIDIEMLSEGPLEEEQATHAAEVDSEYEASDLTGTHSDARASELPDAGPSSIAVQVGEGASTDVSDERSGEDTSAAPVSEGIPNVMTEHPRQRWPTFAVAAIAAVGLVALGIWRVLDTQGTPGSAAPSVSPPDGDGRGSIDTGQAEQESVNFLAEEFSTPKRRVRVTCPDKVPLTEGATFACSFTVDTQGIQVTGAVTYRLVKEEGDLLTLKGNYRFD